MGEEPSSAEIRGRLRSWYDVNRRDLPFRRTRDPYRILIAEYLLQRTRIASGVPYYHRFLKRFPSVQVLAAAPLDDVLAVWEGLGFYRRARNLHAAAQAIVERFGGEIPRSYDDLESLPGMGPYTAGAVASIAFGIPVPAVDGNVTRVIVRLFRIHEDVRTGATRRRIAEIARGLVSPEDPCRLRARRIPGKHLARAPPCRGSSGRAVGSSWRRDGRQGSGASSVARTRPGSSRDLRGRRPRLGSGGAYLLPSEVVGRNLPMHAARTSEVDGDGPLDLVRGGPTTPARAVPPRGDQGSPRSRVVREWVLICMERDKYPPVSEPLI